MPQNKYIVVLSTVPSEEVGKKLASVLLEKKLVPCVNILPNVRSIYTWKGEIRDEAELLMVMKTRASLFDTLKDEIKANHPYECPEILALPVLAAYQPYLDWIQENTFD
ncbi:MAG: divalent-cation tolerance protein CutA [Candidatus Lokiarchaeota archaeon]|nr:divalent-cation tolerance protein CutA [Candidatus Lokiarchaeota archaeon]